MAVCPNCGEDNPERAKFCLACATALSSRVPQTGAERKVVSVLFADLVGFTARSDGADPEDVQATLRLYHRQVKQEIDRFGGTVQKFVGDAESSNSPNGQGGGEAGQVPEPSHSMAPGVDRQASR